MKRIYIVINTQGVGGAEKRFTDIWYELYKRGYDIHLLIDLKAYNALKENNHYAEKLSISQNIIVTDLYGKNYLTYVINLWLFFYKQPKGCIIHFPLSYVPGLRLFFKNKVIVSRVDSHIPTIRLKYIRKYFGYCFAEHIDILDPDVFSYFSSYRLLGKKTTLTEGGTHVDFNIYYPKEKRQDFVFLGRFYYEKQVMQLVESLPEVCRLLRAQEIKHFRFLICGAGEDEGIIRQRISQGDILDLPVLVQYTSRPEEILGHSSIFFSLQRTTNYPSKSLAEAMACGNYIIATDVGKTKMMLDGLEYFSLIPKDFSPVDIANAIISYLSLSKAVQEKITRETAAFAKKKFKISVQADYFAKIYGA